MKSIPVSKIDALITSLEQQKKEAEGKRGIFTDCFIEQIQNLIEIKKEAIPSPSQLEQKIKAFIYDYDKMLKSLQNPEYNTIDFNVGHLIDELRKLLK